MPFKNFMSLVNKSSEACGGLSIIRLFGDFLLLLLFAKILKKSMYLKYMMTF
jgi:hypothetical protein